MKRFLIILSIILFVSIILFGFSFNDMKADGSPENTSGQPQQIALSGTKTNKNDRPKAPSRQSIYCYYDGSILYFSFTYSEGDCDLTVSSAAGLQYHTFSSEEPETVYIGAVSSAYITVVTEAGNTYYGEIE